MRWMSLASMGLVVCLSAFGCGSEDKVLQPDGNTSGDGGGTGSTNGTDSGTANDGSTGSSQGDGDGGGGGNTGGTPSDAACDMNGIWVGRQITQSEAEVIGSQFANNWYYLEFRQDGDDVVVTKHFDCGIEVQSPSLSVEIKPATAKALMQHNLQAGRKGTLKKGTGTVCDFQMERFWSVRGAKEGKYVPSPRNSSQTIAEVSKSNPLPDKDNTTGAEDWDGDGKLGVAWEVLGGTRNTVQRDWTRYFSDATHPFPAGTDFTKDIRVRAEFSNEENVLDPTSGLLARGAMPNATAKHNLTLRFLGRSKSDSRAQALLKADDYATCRAIQAALPAQDGL